MISRTLPASIAVQKNSSLTTWGGRSCGVTFPWEMEESSGECSAPRVIRSLESVTSSRVDPSTRFPTLFAMVRTCASVDTDSKPKEEPWQSSLWDNFYGFWARDFCLRERQLAFLIWSSPPALVRCLDWGW